MARLRFNKPRRERFLKILALGYSVSKAASIARVPISTLYHCRDRDEEFKIAWQEAVNDGTDLIEDEAFRRAVKGVRKPVFQGGKLVGYVREYSDALLIKILAARRPEKYRERHELSGPKGEPLPAASTAVIPVLQLITGGDAKVMADGCHPSSHRTNHDQEITMGERR